MENKFNEIISSQFNDFESGMKELTKKILITLGILPAAGALTIVGCASDFGAAPVLALIGFVTFITCLIIAAKTNGKKKHFITESENSFYDNVYAGIIADEIGGVHTGEFFKKKKGEIEEYLGEVIEKKSEKYTGTLDGKSYSVDFAKGTVISKVYTKDGKTVSYKTETVFTGTDFSVRCNRKADSEIVLVKGLDKPDTDGMKRIKMDDRKFPYEVYCGDDLSAYKFLTPGVMYDLQTLSSSYNISYVDIGNEELELMLNQQIINMDVRFKFSGKVDKLREKYNFGYVYSLAHPQAENFRKLISDSLSIVK